MRSERTISAGHWFVQNQHLGHYELTADIDVQERVRVAFDELASCL